MIKQIIRSKYKDLSIGETTNDLCPICEGGEHHDRSFSVTRRPTGLLFNCFRNKCGIRGFIPEITTTDFTEQPKAFVPKYFNRPLLNLPEEIRLAISVIYGISSENIELQRWKLDITDEGDRRIYIPLFDLDGFNYGALSIKKPFLPGISELPKVVTYKFLDKPMVHYPKTELISGPIVLVEDAISATRIAPLVRSAALLGTHMSASQARSLCAASPSLIVALDADTWEHKVPKPLLIKDEYQFLFEEIRLIKLDKDVKDMTRIEFDKFISEVLEV